MLRRAVSLSVKLEVSVARCFKTSKSYHTTAISRNSFSSNENKNSYQSVPDFYAGKSVLVTGGTGFLGKIFIERLLATCTEIDKVYVLVREKKGINPKERVRDITSDSLFEKLKSTRPYDLNKIVPVEGDISVNDMGIKPIDQDTLLEKVSVVFHSAADVRFNKPLQHLLNVNVEGTRRLLKLCQKMSNIQGFVYVSTAYSNADRFIIDETVYPSPHKLSEVYNFISRVDDPKEIKKFLKGKGNRYTFSKAIAESMVAEEHGVVPSIIVRPSVVGTIKEEPLPGWLDNWHGMTGLFYDVGRGTNNYIYGHKDVVIDYIPADYTVNLSIVAASKCSSNSKEVKVYNTCTSSENPITLRELTDTFSKYYQKIYNDNRKIRIYFFKSTWIIPILSTVTQTIPAYFADYWLRCRGEEPRYMKELRLAEKRRDILMFFTSKSLILKAKNTRNVYASLSKADQQLFPCDPADIAWGKYLKDFCSGVHEHLVHKKNE